MVGFSSRRASVFLTEQLRGAVGEGGAETELTGNASGAKRWSRSGGIDLVDGSYYLIFFREKKGEIKISM